MANGFAEQIVGELEAFFVPITDTQGDPEAILALLSRIGWPLDRIAGVDQQKLVTTIKDLVKKVEELATFAAHPPDQTETLLMELAAKVAPLFSNVVTLKDCLPTGLPPDIDEFPVDVVSYLTTSYLEGRTAPTFHALRLLGIVSDPDPVAEVQNGALYRVRNATSKLRPKQLVDLISKPIPTFRSTYWPAGDDGGVGARTLALKIWDLAIALGLDPDTFDAIAEDLPLLGITPGPDSLGFSYSVALADGAEATAGVRLELGDDGAGGPAVKLAPFGEASITAKSGGWSLSLGGTLQSNPLQVSAAGFKQLDGTAPPFRADLKVARGDAATPAFLLGAKTGTQIRIDELSVSFGLALSSVGPEVILGFQLKPIAFRIALGGADGFLKSTMPGEGIGGTADVGLQWSNKTGVTLKGSASLTIDLADQIVLGPVTIKGLTITLAPRNNTLDLELAATIAAKIGPAAGVIERMGIRVGLSAPAGGGNLGPFNVTLGFKPPNGLGLSIDASVVKGAGYLYIDTERGEYAGALELTFAVFSLKAIGILTTKRPDGSEGWSVLLMIYGQFPSPIQLSFGFTLSGVGGLIGLHHGCDRPQLEKGMSTGAFDSILFPRDPVGDAPTIIGQLRTIFPIRPDALIVGPMLEIGWGSPNIVKIRLGVLIQLDHVFGGGSLSVKQILILGQLDVLLPPMVTPDKALLRLLIDFLGYIDLEEKVVGFVARLRDSHVAIVTITGMIVVRISWVDRPSFVLAAGGFHPKFTDLPPGLPSPIDRVGAGFSIGPVRISIAGYFAVTPATVQTGARVEAQAKLGPVDINGHFGFDTIFYFEPTFHFQIDADCGFAVRWSGHTLAGVDFKGTLSGPGRWHLIGHAEFTVLLWTVPINIDEAWGDPPALPPVAGTNVMELLGKDVATAGNWSAQTPAGGAALVTISAAAGKNQALAHPLSRLSFTQRRVPLKLEMERFGRTPIIGDRRIDFTEVYVGTTAYPPTFSPEFFARSNFVDLSKEQKLAQPSFEPFPAGVDFGTDAYTVGPAVGVPLDYETAYIDPAEPAAAPVRDMMRSHLRFEHLVQQSTHGEAARSRLRIQEKLKPGAGTRFQVTDAPLASAAPDTFKASGVVEAAAKYSPSLVAQASPQGTLVVEAFEIAA